MRPVIIILILVLILTGWKSIQTEEQKTAVEMFDCKKGLMKAAWYEHGIDEAAPDITGLKNEFVILVDTNNKATNFISFDEEYLRERSNKLDTSDLDWIDDWDKLTVKEKFEKVKQEKNNNKVQADSAHFLNNQGQTQVWIINNTKDKVSIQMQDWSYICVLQAKAKDGQWRPIQYWRFSTCGNSYNYKHFQPKTANSFITEIPVKGDFKTTLRYKLLGDGKFYYSNEFTGKINYCEFEEDKGNYNRRRFGTPGPHYKLDSLIKLARRY